MDPSPPKKLLVLELWGIGDLVFATTLLREAATKYDVTLLAKPHARPLLERSLPELLHVSWEAPWTAFTGKYELWRWPWRAIGNLIADLGSRRFDAVVSVRDDPRDHLLMRLIGAPRRIGFPARGSGVLLTDAVHRVSGSQHKVEDWRMIGATLGLVGAAQAEPALRVARAENAGAIPRVCMHLGARIPVRRWPVAYFAEVIGRLRARFKFHLTIVPDLDGYGAELGSLADHVETGLSLDQLTQLLAASDALICNDSAPGHLAAAVGTPVLAFFGPTDPVRYRPWGPAHEVVIRDLCPHRPCFDYCKFPEPYCLTRLTPDEVWPEVEAFMAVLLSRFQARSIS